MYCLSEWTHKSSETIGVNGCEHIISELYYKSICSTDCQSEWICRSCTRTSYQSCKFRYSNQHWSNCSTHCLSEWICRSSTRTFYQVANLDIQTNTGATALHIASQNGHIKVLKVLLLKGVNLNIQTNTKAAAVHRASQNGHTKVKELLVNEANVNTKTNVGAAAHYFASQNGHIESSK